MCVCVRARARACVRACVCESEAEIESDAPGPPSPPPCTHTQHTHTHTHTHTHCCCRKIREQAGSTRKAARNSRDSGGQVPRLHVRGHVSRQGCCWARGSDLQGPRSAKCQRCSEYTSNFGLFRVGFPSVCFQESSGDSEREREGVGSE